MRNRSIRWQRGLTVTGAAALSAALVVAGAATSSADPNAQQAFPGSVPSFVTTAADAGTAADDTVEGEVYLDLQDEAGAQQLATAVSTPGNARYGKYLTPHAWIKKYAPTKADLAAVKKYLKDSGVTITAVPESREYVVFRGKADAVSAAFDTSLHNYRVGSSTVSAPATAPKLPVSVAGRVAGISLGNARTKLTRPDSVVQGQGVPGAVAKAKTAKLKGSGATADGAAKPQPKSQAASDACSTYYGENKATMPEAYGSTKFPTYICGYLPSQLRSAGDLDQSINAGNDGSGVTLGIVDAYASPTIVKDTNDYMRAAGEPLLSKFSQIGAQPSDFTDEALCGGPSGWQGEENLDVQSAHAVAPGASILYSGAANCGGGIDVALSLILDQGKADLVSNSYGYTTEAVGSDVIRGQQNLHIQAAGTGIGLYYSTGDDGDNSATLGKAAANWPATSPFVTAVGGTSESISSKGNYRSEVGWGDILDQVAGGKYTAALPGDLYGGGGGGGISSVIAEPAYQKGVVPKELSGRGTKASRVIPDVSDLADPYTGYQIAIRPILDDSTLETGPLEYETYGGTSLASPLVAGKMALVQQLSKHRIGFANPALYQQSGNAKAYHDVTASTDPVAISYTSAGSGTQYLNTFDQGFTLTGATGYDDFTGIGSLKVPGLAKLLKKSAAGA
ncbi:S53 family peptidase [Microlunatus soli]|uniref:Subtilase family protein n=1 Tax=Microlunatus soli TaxID=630515 RepID=A0A1H1UV84_9ACTN|nr:S53 family peptidase [Microlunatus soli]SDS76407.1 Subtilase family protein [Microlunatus soli]